MYKVQKAEEGYEIVRESDGQVMARQRLKKDADHQASGLKARASRDGS